tara:strand:+ start:80 stop:334 length:255 start_codon:yes stop_codon:yes gene_type:complete
MLLVERLTYSPCVGTALFVPLVLEKVLSLHVVVIFVDGVLVVVDDKVLSVLAERLVVVEVFSVHIVVVLVDDVLLLHGVQLEID